MTPDYTDLELRVVDRIIGLESRLRTDADYAERDAAWDKADQDSRETTRARLTTVGDVLAAIRDSR